MHKNSFQFPLNLVIKVPSAICPWILCLPYTSNSSSLRDSSKNLWEVPPKVMLIKEVCEGNR